MTMTMKSIARLYELKQKGSKSRSFAEEQELKKLKIKFESDKLDQQELKARAELAEIFVTAEVDENGNQLLIKHQNAINKYTDKNTKPFSREEIISLHKHFRELVIAGIKEKEHTMKKKRATSQNQNKNEDNLKRPF